MTETVRRGGCLCGEVRYEAHGPLRGVVFCHCTLCRIQGAPVTAGVARENFHLLKGATLKSYTSSDDAKRWFCEHCGAAIYWEPFGECFYAIFAGSLDQPTGMRTEKHIFTADKPDYYEIHDSTPRFAGPEFGDEAATTRPRRFAVLDCEDAPKWEGHERFWLEGLRRDNDHWSVYRAYREEFPEKIDAYDGYLITGSCYSVLDDLPWLKPLERFVSECIALRDGPMVVGACFGAQLIAQATRGTVAPNPSGRFSFGVETIALAPEFLTSWFCEAPGKDVERDSSVRLLTSHADSVTELPPTATLLGTSPATPNEIFLIPDRALAIQGHPELTTESMLQTILPTLRERGRLSPEEENAALAALERGHQGEWMMRVIRRFLEGRA